MKTLRVSVAQITCIDGSVELKTADKFQGPSGREIIRLIEFQGYLNYTFNRLRKRSQMK